VVLSALGVAAILATIVLLLGIERQVVATQRKQEHDTVVGDTKKRCDLLKEVLLARLKGVLARHPDAVSLLEVADEVRTEMDAFRTLHETGQGIKLLVVDEKLQPIASVNPEASRQLRRCARHVLEERQSVYTLPRGCERTGEMPTHLCYTCPIRRGGRPLGGIVIYKELDRVGDVFSAVNRTMTWAVVATQSVLLLALAAIACSARKAVAAAERRRAEDERLAAVGNLAAGIAHEIRNPLNTISLTCRYLDRLVSKSEQDATLRAEVNKNFEVVASELGRLTRTLDDFLLLAKPTDLSVAECDVEELLDDALALFGREFEQANIRLVRRRAGSLPIAGDPERLRQVFSNLIKNSIQAMGDGGTLSVATEQANGRARVAFADTGPGISEGNTHHIFEPYFSTKRSGLGLGLPLSLKIVEAHGGTIDVANRPDGGSVFTVTLPANPRAREGSHGG